MSGRDYTYAYHEPPDMRGDWMERRAEGLEGRGEARAAEMRARLEAEGYDEETISRMLAEYGALTAEEHRRGDIAADIIHFEHGQPVFTQREDPWRQLAQRLVGMGGQIGAQNIGMQLGQRTPGTREN